MATTKIWSVNSHFARVVEYAKNPDKTENPDWSKQDVQALRDVMDYAMDDHKTEKQYFATGLYCDPSIAREQMWMVKEQFGKAGGILAFHGYQSFAEGEVSAEVAHKIGTELAQQLWPDYQVIVATHLNTKCYHNHFVINSVSYLHGGKYNDCKATYQRMRQASDDLCRQHGLSIIIENKEVSKHYAEWLAERGNQPTWRTAIRQDVNAAIAASMTWTAFLKNLRAQGYEIKTGVKHLAVRPPGKERFVRLRSMGDSFTEDAIKRRILRQQVPTRMPRASPPIMQQGQFNDTFDTFALQKVTYKSIRALYYHYLRKLRQTRESQTSAPFPLREDLWLFDQIVAQYKYLNAHRIDTAEQLLSHLSMVTGEMDVLIAERKSLSDEKRRTITPAERKTEIAGRITEIGAQLKGLRQEARLCDAILERSLRIREKQEQQRQFAQQQKERDRNTGRSHSRPEEHVRE